MTSVNSTAQASAGSKKKPKRKGRRHHSRELVLQGIYQWRVAGGSVDFIETQLRETNGFSQADEKYFIKLLQGVLADTKMLEAQIQPYLDRSLRLLSPVEFSVLLISTYELINYIEIPYRAIINEAIELTKSFGGTDGHKYVNGVLNKLAAQIRAIEIQDKSLHVVPAKKKLPPDS